MGDFQEDNFEQKLLLLKDTQDSIQSLSVWCLKHQQQHKKVVSCWLHVLRKVKVEQRLSLFYLANDVIQYSKRKNYPFVESWAPALQKATPLVRDDKVRHKILRLFKIWNERNIYDETFLTDLSGLLTAHTKKSKQLSTADLIQEFQPTLLFSKIRKCKLLEEDTDLKLKILKECTIPVSDPDALSIVVKDRRNGDDLLLDLDDGIQKLEAYTKALELEIKERTEVINVLEVSEQFYDTQRGEAKVVCNAYRNFGNRVKSLKRKLEELLPTLPSPVPSPDVNAPSPSSGSDIDIPEDNKPVCYDSEKSFIGTDFVTALNNANEKQADMIRNVSQNYQNLDMGNANYGMHVQTNYEDYSSGKDLNMISAGYYKNNCQLDLDSPASPISTHINDSYLYHPEGNPIEVISSSNNDNHSSFGVSSFLQSIITTNSTTPTPVPPVQAKIPGLESPTDNAREVFSFIESKVKVDDTGPVMWGDKPLTKYQSWPSPDISWSNTQETPVSPPAFEQESFSNPVEYVDSNIDNSRFSIPFNNVHRLADVDHRLPNTKPNDGRTKFDQVATIPLPKHDIDDRIPMQNAVPNRNLISLTESPSVNDSWKVSDSDYRVGPLPLPSSVIDSVRNIKTPQDNIESVDMEMSDDESDSKHDDRGNGNRHRKPSFKDEDAIYKKTNQAPPQLLPPPNPWDMVNISLDNANQDNNSKNISHKVKFDKMMSFLSNPPPTIEPPPMPEFPCFQMPRPPASDVKSFNDMRFPRPPDLSVPPLGDPKMFQSRPDFPPPPPMPPTNLSNRMPGGGFNHPFGFMPFSQPGSNSNPMFANSMNQSPRKEFAAGPGFQPSEPPLVFQSSVPVPGYEATELSSKNKQFSRNNISNIEPIIKTRLFDKRLSENAAAFENVPEYPTKSIRSNLKEISLSDVLEKSISFTRDEEVDEKKADLQSNSGEADRTNNTSLISIAEDLFNEESAQNDNVDDGDDLYNDIDETSVEHEGDVLKDDSKMTDTNDEHGLGLKHVPSDSKFVQNNHFESHDVGVTQNITNTEDERKASDFKSLRKIPFQGVVPKMSKPSIAPPNFIEDDQRNPWPLMPVIDLSNENNSSENYPGDEDVDDEHTAAFTTQDDSLGEERGGFNPQGMKNDFRPRLFNNFESERRFSSPGQSPMRFRGDTMNRVRARFMSPRSDFRSRVGNNFSPNQDQMRRMPRPPFNSSNTRGNFQNSPRIFKGRPGRLFRRGW